MPIPVGNGAKKVNIVTKITFIVTKMTFIVAKMAFIVAKMADFAEEMPDFIREMPDFPVKMGNIIREMADFAAKMGNIIGKMPDFAVKITFIVTKKVNIVRKTTDIVAKKTVIVTTKTGAMPAMAGIARRQWISARIPPETTLHPTVAMPPPAAPPAGHPASGAWGCRHIGNLASEGDLPTAAPICQAKTFKTFHLTGNARPAFLGIRKTSDPICQRHMPTTTTRLRLNKMLGVIEHLL